jgi:hypothetical protein
MGNLCSYYCQCPCLESRWSAQPSDHVYEIHAEASDLLTLHDGLASFFTPGAHDEVVFDKTILLVIAGIKNRKCYSAWVPETTQLFENYESNFTTVLAVLRDTTNSINTEEVIIVHDSAQIFPCP